MNPYDEEGLRDEVMYLHSLWHQGPPPPQPNPIHLPIRTLHHHAIPFSTSQPYIPQPLALHFHPHPLLRPHHQQQRQQRTIYPPTPAHTRSLPPVTSTSFKKKNNKKKKKKKKGSGVSDSTSHNVTIPDPGSEWPCPASPGPPARTGWGSSKPLSDPPLPVSPQEKERLAALKAQHKACQAFKKFLFGSDGEDDDDGDDSEDDDDDDDEDGEELQKFFLGIFLEGNELRGYYQRCFESGEFCCLVCDAVGKKNSGKKFKDCAGLVQHSMSILRTVKKRAHRAFGQVVCKVMGWDIDRLPTIVMKGEPLGCYVEMKQAQEEPEGEPKENVAAADEGGRDGSHKSDDKVVALEHGDGPVKQNAQGVDQSIGECSCKEGVIDEKMLDTGLENGGGGDIYEGEPKEKVDDDGKNGNHKSDDIVVSLGHGDEPVEEHARGVDQSISECSSKEGNLNNNAENLDEKMLDIELKKGGGGAIDEVHHESLASGAEWVCKIPNCDSSSTASGWPSFNTNSSSQICSPSAEEQARVAVLQMQHKALEACQEYLVGNAGSDCDDGNDDEDEDELINYYDPEECEEFKFFLRLFTEDSDLRRYYENNHREGDFFCLVCGGIRKKMWKRFKDCIALLQHSTAIKRTKRKRAHRAYSQVICKVLGWDIDGLPAIVLKGESLGSSLSGSRKLPGESEKTADSDIGDSNGEPEKPVDSHNDNSNVLQENQAK